MADKIRVMIVDDNESTREGTSRLLEYEDNIEIVGFADNGAEAVERVKELSPQVVLMDINMPIMNGIDATAQISQVAPQTKVIMVSVQDDSQYLKQAFRAGAVDFVAKPITSAELAQAIERAYNSIQAAPPPVQQPVAPMPGAPAGWPAMPGAANVGHVIGVLGFKGGMGKTTIAVNLGVGLAKAGKKVVIVDTNTLFGDVAVFLNARGQHNVVDFARLSTEPDSMDSDSMNTILVAHESGVKLLIAPANPSESEPISNEVMSTMLTLLKREFDYVIVDTSTGFDEILLATIQSAEKLIVLTTPTMPALKNAKFLLGELSGLESTDKVMLILNQIDKSSSITGDQIANYLKVPVVAQLPLDPSVNSALNQGVALITLDPKRIPSARSLLDVVQLVRNTFEAEAVAEEAPKPRGGLFGRGG